MSLFNLPKRWTFFKWRCWQDTSRAMSFHRFNPRTLFIQQIYWLLVTPTHTQTHICSTPYIDSCTDVLYTASLYNNKLHDANLASVLSTEPFMRCLLPDLNCSMFTTSFPRERDVVKSIEGTSTGAAVCLNVLRQTSIGYFPRGFCVRVGYG